MRGLLTASTLQRVDLSGAHPLEAFAVLADHVTVHQRVLHGTPAPITGALEPRTANDGSKAAGNQTGVYATTLPHVAIWNAVVDRARLRAQLGSFRLGWRLEVDGIGLGATPAARALIDTDPDVFVDGWVHVLTRAAFERIDELGIEWICRRTIAPSITVRVPRSCGPLLWAASRSHTLAE